MREPYNSLNRIKTNGELKEDNEFYHYQRYASSPYHYDESIAKLAMDMPLYRAVRASFEKAGVHRKFIGYTTVNFADTAAMPGYAEAEERFFLHTPGKNVTKDNRVKFAERGALNAGGDVFDIRNPEFHIYIADKIVDAMNVNNIDAILIDYSASQFAFGSGIPELMPIDWFSHFEENQFNLLSRISERAASSGKEIFCNGLTLDGIYHTDPKKARLFLSACHGAFWEQPFRTEWRDNGPDPENYYKRLQQLFDIALELGKTIIIKQGSYRFHGAEDIDPGWKWRFRKTTREKERQIMNYCLAFYLLYTQGGMTPLIYSHPTSILDIFASEAFFSELEIDIGKPLGPRYRIADHVQVRHFSKATVVLNNRDEPFYGVIPAAQKGVRLPGELRLPALSGRIINAQI
ncbi:putative glycoside hydrolase [Bosea sp. AAP35]|uniref:putative glycoside hydrolase n=1 Tax=Bosea sp. AAP35 TaxID=1523417 RepID=UPI0018D02EA9|nr:putative glycoside hydrolase [Bosea sp. AAP35]